MTAPLTLEEVAFTFAGTTRPVLNGVDLQLERGTLAVLAGDSGAGKSTLLRCAMGLVPAFSGGVMRGRVLVSGRDTRRFPARRLAGLAGLVLQDPERQMVSGQVWSEVAFGPANLGLERGEVQRRVEEALESVGGLALAGRSTDSISGGEAQRVALAAVLAMQPGLLLLDEPTSQLDPWAAESIAGLIRQAASSGAAVLVSEQRCERFDTPGVRRLLLHHGRVREGWADGASEVSVSGAPISVPVEGGLRVDHLSVHIDGQQILQDVAYEVAPGRVTALLGRNGSGKTTLLRATAGLVAHTGEVRSPARPLYVPQDPHRLLYRETLADELRWSVRAAGGAPATDPRSSPVVSWLGLATSLDRYPRDLSCGERARAAVAAVLAGHPPVALLDEPTRGMDLSARAGLAGLLRSLARAGASVVVATHDLDFAALVADDCLLLDGGAVAHRGSLRATVSAAGIPDAAARPCSAVPA
ncbi:MAG: ABC transporter ATP-binding protein [Candidatus Dormibacteria bacterium]